MEYFLDFPTSATRMEEVATVLPKVTFLEISGRFLPHRLLHLDGPLRDPDLRAGGGGGTVPGGGRDDAGRSSVSSAGRDWDGHHGAGQSPQHLLLCHSGLGYILPHSQSRHPASPPLGHLWLVQTPNLSHLSSLLILQTPGGTLRWSRATNNLNCSNLSFKI